MRRIWFSALICVLGAVPGSAGPLHDAVARFDVGRIETLLAARVDVEAVDESGRTALHVAAAKGFAGIVDRLVATGAPIDVRDSGDGTPLLLAAAGGHESVARILLAEGAEVDARDADDNTPLLLAVRKGHAPLARTLIAHGADGAVKNARDWTPLHLAARYGHRAIVALLIDNGVDLEARNEFGATPLNLANQSNHIGVEELLIAAGADVRAAAQGAEHPYVAEVAEWMTSLAAIKLEMARPVIGDGQLEDLGSRLQDLGQEITRFTAGARRHAESVGRLLGALGPAPEADGGAEPAAVAERRGLLEDEYAFYNGRIDQAELAATQTGMLLRQIAHRRQSRFAETIFRRGPSPLAATIWVAAAGAVADGVAEIAETLRETVEAQAFSDGWRSALAKAAGAGAVVVVAAWLIQAWLIRGFGQNASLKSPSYARRLVAIVVEGTARTLPFAAGAAVFGLVFVGSGILAPEVGHTAIDLLAAGVFLQFARCLTNKALVPDPPVWRVAPLAEKSAREVRRLFHLLAVLAAFDWIVVHSEGIIEASEEMAVAYGLAISTFFAVLFIGLSRPRLWRLERRKRRKRGGVWPLLRLAAAAVALAIPLSALFGYAALSRFLAERLLLTGLVCLLLLIVNRLIRELVGHALSPRSKLGAVVDRTLEIGERNRRLLSFWLSGGIGLALFVAGILVLLPFWGMSWQDLSEFLYRAVFGFKLGETTISLVDIAIALALFIAVLTLTRFFQRVLGEQILTRTRLDIGIRHSLRAAVGYVGVGIAAAIAVSTLGIDLSNLAIILGALSVGIGLGLQNVVNNFVSGLILLIERPIKVGDKITVGPHVGFVQRINVRATEIETLDKGHVIVPNSELLSQSVLNWTHKNRIGRAVIRVDVGAGAKPQKVRDVLLACAAASPDVVDKPKPQVLFHGFGDNALNFELWAYTRDNENIDIIASNLRFAIDAAFRKARIPAPVPKREVDLKESPRASAKRQPAPYSRPGRRLPKS